LPSTQPNTTNTANQFNRGTSAQLNQSGTTQFNQPGTARGLQPSQTGLGTRSGTYQSDDRYGAERGIGAQGDLNNLPRDAQSRQTENTFGEPGAQGGRRDADFQNGTRDRMPPPDNSQSRQSSATNNRDRDGRHGELGVWLGGANGRGVAIRRVTPGSAADEIGLSSGDVLLQIDGQPVHSPMEVQRIIRSMPANEVVVLEVWRDGMQQELSTTLQPARESHRVGYRGDQTGYTSDGNMNSRTERLEEQVGMLMREVGQLRAQLQQQSTSAPAPSAALQQPMPRRETSPFDSAASDRAASETTAPEPIESTSSIPARPERSATEPPAAAIEQPAQAASNDSLFDNEPAAEATVEETEVEATPATETDAETDSDSLFE
jgi:hypothetical protein